MRFFSKYELHMNTYELQIYGTILRELKKKCASNFVHHRPLTTIIPQKSKNIFELPVNRTRGKCLEGAYVTTTPVVLFKEQPFFFWLYLPF